MRGIRRPGTLDATIYLRGVGVLAKTPLLVVPIFVTHFLVVLIFGGAVAGGGGGFGGGLITSLLTQIVTGLGLALTIIGADVAWRGRKESLRDWWETARRRLGDIIWATIGFNFVLYVASLLGSFFGFAGVAGLYLSLALNAVALFLFIYTSPAAAIGGIPGMASLNVSVEQAKAQPLPTGVITAVYLLFNTVLPTFALPWVTIQLAIYAPNLAAYDIAFVIAELAVLAIFQTYVAVVLAKVYDDLATRRFFFGR